MILKNKKLQFTNSFDRMAYITMEYVTGAQTQQELAFKLGLSPQRIAQIYLDGLGVARAAPLADPALIGCGLSAARRRYLGQVTPLESFHVHERWEGACA